MHQDSIGIEPLEPFDCGRSAMGGAIIDNPEDPLGATVGFLVHDLLDQSAKGLNTSGQSAAAFILELYAHSLLGLGRQSGVQTDASLDTGFFVSRNHEIILCQSLAFPKPLIEIQDSLGFGLKVRIARKDPTAMLPRTN